MVYGLLSPDSHSGRAWRKPASRGGQSTMSRAPGDVTQLLADLQDGRPDSASHLIPLVYDELHRLAHRHMRQERPITRSRPRPWCTKRMCDW